MCKKNNFRCSHWKQKSPMGFLWWPSWISLRTMAIFITFEPYMLFIEGLSSCHWSKLKMNSRLRGMHLGTFIGWWKSALVFITRLQSLWHVMSMLWFWLKHMAPQKKVNKTGARENLSRWRLPENIEVKLLFSFYKKSPNYSKYMDIAPYLVVKIIV